MVLYLVKRSSHAMSCYAFSEMIHMINLDGDIRMLYMVSSWSFYMAATYWLIMIGMTVMVTLKAEAMMRSAGVIAKLKRNLLRKIYHILTICLFLPIYFIQVSVNERVEYNLVSGRDCACWINNEDDG